MATVTKVRWTQNGKAGEAWQVRYTDAAGKRRGKNFELKREADKYRLKVETELDGGVHVPARASMRVADLVTEYLAHCETRVAERRNMGRSHLCGIRQTMKTHVVPEFGARLIRDLTLAQVEDWMGRLTTEKNLRPSYVGSIATKLNRVAQFAVKRGYLAKNVVADALRERRGIPRDTVRTFTAEQVMTLLRTVEQRPKFYAFKAHAKLKAYVHVAAFCGLRWGEITGLTMDSIDLAARLLRVRHNMTQYGELKGPKTTAGNRDVPMPAHVAELLRAWIADHYAPNPRQVVFQNDRDQHWTAGNFHGAWQELLKQAGLGRCDRLGMFHFHALRHFAASSMIGAGLPIMDVAAVLGHNSFDMTLQVYAHPIVPGHRRLEMSDRLAASLLPSGGSIAQICHNQVEQAA